MSTPPDSWASVLRVAHVCSHVQTKSCGGHAGEMYRGVFDALQQQLQQPAHQHSTFFPTGQRRILPSFFELLLHLQATHRCFTIVFRTFGTDLQDVIDEINLFATGQHPSWPDARLDGSDGVTDIRLAMPAQTGAFYRRGRSAGCGPPAHACIRLPCHAITVMLGSSGEAAASGDDGQFTCAFTGIMPHCWPA